MKKNKLLSFLLAGCLLLAGCSGGDEPETEVTTDGNTYVDVTDANGEVVTDDNGNPVTEVIPAVPVEKELVVGFIYSGKAGGNAAADYFEAARGEAERVLGAKTYYIEDVLVSQFEQATAALVDKGCNVIVSTDARFVNAVSDEAKANNKVQFVSFGGNNSMGNLASFQGQLYKPAYVCGFAAAYNSDSNILGVLADPSVISVYPLIDAFALGAKELTELQTDIRVNWAWGSKDTEVKEAIDDLIAQGCDVIYCASYSKFAVEYCETMGVKVSGMFYNMPEIAPNQYLTGSFCNLNIFLIDVLRTVRYNTDPVGVYRGGINEGAVRVVAISEKAKEGTQKLTDKLYELCSDNKAAVFSGEIKDSNGEVKVPKGKTLSLEDIYTIDWLESSFKVEKNFCQPVTQPVPSDLYVHEPVSQAGDTQTTAGDTENEPEEAPVETDK
ncbi:MAG: BMP family ABC transporter substrate-binding protein [Ruminiclostridium sp.]|nr:BMP family ABC transporter substrate-binding protein [Ruminiclostridium sp.]